MTGLDKIINRINEDSKNSVESIENSARLEAEKIISEAETEAENKASAILDAARVSAHLISERAASSADIEVNRRVLAKKQEVISGVIESAREKLKNLDDDKYFEIIEDLLEKHKTGDGGKLILSAKDKARLPKGFDLKGLSLSETDGEFDGGFVLVYGNIEINCTFDALFEGAYDELSDTVNKIMFGSR